jgi:LmbE family N-acetylglucosaminyl deacetylase
VIHEPPFFIPDGLPESIALARTTHLGIGAHPDDLEIMALHGILSCSREQDRWFGGITCTSGAGSIRQGEICAIGIEELTKRRHQEQNEAARIGKYSFMAQLGLHSPDIQENPTECLTNRLLPILSACHPDMVYTHNPADKHPTHIAVLKAVIEAYRQLPAGLRPGRLLGCEVWRNLDWVSDSQKVVLSIEDPDHLAPRLIGVYKSQISAGKQYDKAIEGRRRANATFYQTLSQDAAEQAIYAIDMTPMLEDRTLTLEQFIRPILDRFRDEVVTGLADLAPNKHP